MIPSILWQTWKTKAIPTSVKKQADSWGFYNPQLKINLMDDNDCSKFILDQFGDEVYKLYMALPQPIMRADFWRISVVYVYGGYYSDLDITCYKNISAFINVNVNLVVMREINNISNYFFGAAPNHPVIKLALDHMIQEMKSITSKDTQSFGMHGLHSAVRKYFNIVGTNYLNNDEVQYLIDSEVRNSKTLIHSMASLNGKSDYESWRVSNAIMNKDREDSKDVLFFTTFNKNGYELYGKKWIETFILVANYYNKFKAKIYYEGFKPDTNHPSIQWIDYNEAIPNHQEWKDEYNNKTTHSDYVKTMTVRFSHKAFVIQHALKNNNNNYLIWLDGDCVFKNTDFNDFPASLVEDKLLACQVEHAKDLNHVESGILIFNGKHADKEVFVNAFKKWYEVSNILPMGQPYDGFLVFKTLLTTGVEYVDLNKNFGKGGIQSDPNMTFCHPELKSRFIHNIGWSGKNQYENWEVVYQRDDIYKKMKSILFNTGQDQEKNIKKEKAFNKLDQLRKLKK